MDYNGFTADVVARLVAIPGVYGLWPSTWPETPPVLIMSTRVRHADIWEVITQHYTSPERPYVRQIIYADDVVPFDVRMRQAHELIDWALDRDVVVDVAYPVAAYRRIYVELPWQDPSGAFTAQPPRWLRARAANVAPGDWPIEIRERPWPEAVAALDVPPLGHERGPVPIGRRAPAWISDAAQHVYDILDRVVPPGLRVTWEPDEIRDDGRLYAMWSDGPLVPSVLTLLEIEVTPPRRNVLTFDGHRIDIVVSRGLSQAFYLAALEARPDLMLDDHPFSRVQDHVAGAEVDPDLVAAWGAALRSEPFDRTWDKEPVRAYLARHREAVAQQHRAAAQPTVPDQSQ